MENECFKIPYIAPPSQPHNVGERPQNHGGENRECRTRVINIIFCETELTPRHSPNGLAMRPSANSADIQHYDHVLETRVLGWLISLYNVSYLNDKI